MSPVFIVGAPRSGTSLMRAVLNRHSLIGLCDETYFFYYVYSRRRSFGDLSQIESRRRLVNQYLSTFRIRRLGLDPDVLSERLMDEGKSYRDFFSSLLRFYAGQMGKVVWGEKTPQHAFHLKTLLRWYPDCKVILIVRDPRDVVASLLRMPWGSRSVLANARLWLTSNRSATNLGHLRNVLTVKYEALIREPERMFASVCSFVGEDYQPAMLTPKKVEHVDRWWFLRASGPIRKDRVGVWREELGSRQVALIEWMAGDLASKLGYERSRPPVSIRSCCREGFYDCITWLGEKLMKIPHLWRFWVDRTQLASEEAWIDARANRLREPTTR